MPGADRRAPLGWHFHAAFARGHDRFSGPHRRLELVRRGDRRAARRDPRADQPARDDCDARAARAARRRPARSSWCRGRDDDRHPLRHAARRALERGPRALQSSAVGHARRDRSHRPPRAVAGAARLPARAPRCTAVTPLGLDQSRRRDGDRGRAGVHRGHVRPAVARVRRRDRDRAVECRAPRRRPCVAHDLHRGWPSVRRGRGGGPRPLAHAARRLRARVHAPGSGRARPGHDDGTGGGSVRRGVPDRRGENRGDVGGAGRGGFARGHAHDGLAARDGSRRVTPGPARPHVGLRLYLSRQALRRHDQRAGRVRRRRPLGRRDGRARGPVRRRRGRARSLLAAAPLSAIGATACKSRAPPGRPPACR